jgi:hypothetical protein
MSELFLGQQLSAGRALINVSQREWRVQLVYT